MNRLGGLEQPGRRAAGCVAPAENGVQIVRHQHVPVAGQILEMNEVISDPVAQAGFAVVENRVDGEEAEPIIDVDRRLDGCDELLLRRLGQEPAQPDQVPPVVLGGIGFLEVNLPVRLGLLAEVGEVGFHRAGAEGAVNVHRAKVMAVREVAVHDIVVRIQPVHRVAGNGGVCAIQADAHESGAAH